MSLINVLDNEFTVPTFVFDQPLFIVYIQQELDFTVQTRERCLIQPFQLCDPQEVEL